MAQQKRIRLGTMRLWVQSLTLLSGLRIWHWRELWCRSQTRLESGVGRQQQFQLDLYPGNLHMPWEWPSKDKKKLKIKKKEEFHYGSAG